MFERHIEIPVLSRDLRYAAHGVFGAKIVSSQPKTGDVDHRPAVSGRDFATRAALPECGISAIDPNHVGAIVHHHFGKSAIAK